MRSPSSWPSHCVRLTGKPERLRNAAARSRAVCRRAGRAARRLLKANIQQQLRRTSTAHERESAHRAEQAAGHGRRQLAERRARISSCWMPSGRALAALNWMHSEAAGSRAGRRSGQQAEQRAAAAPNSSARRRQERTLHALETRPHGRGNWPGRHGRTAR